VAAATADTIIFVAAQTWSNSLPRLSTYNNEFLSTQTFSSLSFTNAPTFGVLVPQQWSTLVHFNSAQLDPASPDTGWLFSIQAAARVDSRALI